jgi:hypothetical protein
MEVQVPLRSVRERTPVEISEPELRFLQRRRPLVPLSRKEFEGATEVAND